MTLVAAIRDKKIQLASLFSDKSISLSLYIREDAYQQLRREAHWSSWAFPSDTSCSVQYETFNVFVVHEKDHPEFEILVKIL